jgi:hypothetical protein|tara:strand:- start:619 stop:1572 length:954 start_codon:yes stop_codon:yes gene_type:complete
MSEQWSTIEVEASEKKPEVEIEIEGQEEVQAAPEIVTDETPDNGEEKELEGIETQGAQKRIRQLIKQRKERDTELNTLRNELSSLKDTVREKDTQLSSSFKNSIDTNESKLTSTLEIAKDVYKQAAESGDTDRMLAAQETISKTYADMSQVDNQKRAWEDYNNKVQASVQEIQQNPDVAQNYDPKAVEWASKNSWFGTDNIMTSAALMIDNELKEEGYDPSDDDFYNKVDEVLRQRYPHKFADSTAENQTPRLQDTSSNSAQVVAGASRTPKTSKAKNKVKLTQEDLRLADKWGISIEKYAAEKLKVEQADGDYTSI